MGEFPPFVEKSSRVKQQLSLTALHPAKVAKPPYWFSAFSPSFTEFWSNLTRNWTYGPCEV
jgi:hypothetical protein